MKKPRLIPMIIVFIMMFNCLLPVLPVRATTNKVINFSSELYTAIKEELIKQEVKAVYNDAQRKITMSEEEITKIDTLILKEKGISDISGLENFINLKVLDLSGNKLTSESNLDKLSKLKLENLNLSSNEIEDVSMIENFKNISTLDIENQLIERVDVLNLDTTKNSNHQTTYSLKLPQILSFIDIVSDLDLEKDIIASSDNILLDAKWTTLSVDENGVPTLEISVAGFTEGNYRINDGMFKLEINIPGENKLKNSKMTIALFVCDEEQRVAAFKDNNLYNIVKGQLTKGQIINNELRTYEGGENLYIKAYDDVKILVLDLNTVINEIPSLLITNQRVKDLSGLETFVGLESDLDLSYNYVDTIERILELQENKEIETEILQSKFAAQINEVIVPIRAKLDEHLDAIDAIDDAIMEAINRADAAIKKIEKIQENTTLKEEEKSKQIAEQEKIIEEVGNAVNGYIDEEGKEQVGLYDLRAEEVAEADKWLNKLVPQLAVLYNIYNKEYKATTILTLDLHDITKEEYERLTKEEAKALLENQISKIEKLEASRSISTFEESFFESALGAIDRKDKEGNKIVNPISTHIKKLVEENKEIWSATNYKDVLESIIVVDTMAQIYYNYPSLYLNYNVGDYKSLTNREAIEILVEAAENLKEDASDKIAVGYQGVIDQLKAELLKSDEQLSDSYKNAMIMAANLEIMSVDVEANSNDAASLSQILGISGKFVNLTEQEIVRYIRLPELENINLQNNMLENVDGIEVLSELEKLNISENLIVNLNNIDWAKLTKLQELDLHFNFISDISKLSKLSNLVKLNVANNLLAGKFNLNIAKMIKLNEADFSGNAYDDLENLINQYRLIAKDAGVNVNEYIMNKVDLKFYNQNLTVNLNEKIILNAEESQIIKNVKIPAIFKQVEELDSRTDFGTQSIYGKVKADGTVGLMIAKQVGNHSGLVTIDTKDYQDGLSIGAGTICQINYEVVKSTVDGIDIKVKDNREFAIIDGNTQFEAELTATNVEDKSVIWSVEGNTSGNTKIDANGTLYVSFDETAEKLIVSATSRFDNSVKVSMAVKVAKADVVIVINESAANPGIKPGEVVKYSAKIETEANNKDINWTIEGNTSEATNIIVNENGVILTVAEDEAINGTITVTATSDYDNAKSAAVIEKIVSNSIVVKPGETTKPVEPENPGNTTKPTEPENPGNTNEPAKDKVEIKYNTKDEIVYVEKPNTTIKEFVEGIVDSEYNITVSDGAGNKVTDDTKVILTGMVVAIGDSIENTYEIVVTGDINSDGRVDSMDSNLVKAHRVETSKLEGVALEAADINKDGKVNKIDSFLLLYYRADKIDDFSEVTIEKVMK